MMVVIVRASELILGTLGPKLKIVENAPNWLAGSIKFGFSIYQKRHFKNAYLSYHPG